MRGTENPRRKLVRLVRALSGMTAHLGYGIAVGFDRDALGVYRLSDPDRTWIAILCSTPVSDPDEPYTTSREERESNLLETYESRPSWTIYFYGGVNCMTLPGGSVEEIELKAAVGVKACLTDVYVS